MSHTLVPAIARRAILILLVAMAASLSTSHTAGAVGSPVSGAAAVTPNVTIGLAPNGLPAYFPNSLRFRYYSAVGCNFTITNTTSVTQSITFGSTPYPPFRYLMSIAPGAVAGAGIGAPMTTAFFSLMSNQRAVLRVACL
jgi:hypothetical protein